jgi:hypothetical protein
MTNEYSKPTIADLGTLRELTAKKTAEFAPPIPAPGGTRKKDSAPTGTGHSGVTY